MTGRRVGYVVSRFPKTTETFILREMQAVDRHGWRVVPFAIKRERDEIRQPGVEPYLCALTAISDLGVRSAAAAQLRLWFRRPATAGRLWWRAVRGNIGSTKFLARAVVVAWGAPALAEVATRRGVRHLHAHWGTHSALLAHLMSHVMSVPYSITLHAHDLHVDQTMLATKLAGAERVVTISRHNEDIIRAQFPSVAARTSVIHCGVDTAELVPGARSATNIEAGANVQGCRIACVAGLRAFKGHRHLLEALRLLRARGVRVTCDLVGDGPLRDELERLAPPGVVFHGAVPVDVAIDLVRNASVFVMPSVELADGRRDGIPVALIEAMALGVPVVATSVSGIPELVIDGETGLLVPPEDPASLADAIEALLGDADRRDELSRYARELVAQDFDLSSSAAAMCELFEAATRG